MEKSIANMFEGKFCDFKNLLLYTPLDKRFYNSVPLEFSKYMNEERFLKEFFVHDGLEKEIEQLNKTLSDIQENAEFTDDDYEEIDSIKDKLLYLNNELTKKSDFEKKIKDYSENPFLVRGYSGSGKTTYIHHLINNMEEDLVWINYDLFESAKSFVIFGYLWSNDKFNFTKFKLVSLLLKKMSELLIDNAATEKENKQLLSKILTNYNNIFYSKGIRIYESLFSIINDYLNGKITFQKLSFNDDSPNLMDKLYFYFEDFISFNKNTSVNTIDIDNLLTNLLQLTVVIIICRHGSHEKNGFKMPTVYLTFDNIEHYVDNNKVFDEDIAEITTIIFNFLSSQNNILPIDFYQFFRLVLLVRDTTDKILNPNHWHDEDFPNNSVDVSDWFNTLEIYQSKIDYFKQKGILSRYDNIDNICTALKYILEDNTYKGLNTIISKMYNNNKRRITRYLVTAIMMYADRTKQYVDLWEKSQNCTDTSLQQIYKHAARSIIKRSLYDLIENKQYFSNLKTIVENGDEVGLGVARRLLTVLYRLSLQQIDDVEGYIGLHMFLKNLLDSPVHNSDNEEKIKEK